MEDMGQGEAFRILPQVPEVRGSVMCWCGRRMWWWMEGVYRRDREDNRVCGWW